MALEQGFKLSDFDFNDENVLKKFGLESTRVFSTISSISQWDDTKSIIQITEKENESQDFESIEEKLWVIK